MEPPPNSDQPKPSPYRFLSGPPRSHIAPKGTTNDKNQGAVGEEGSRPQPLDGARPRPRFSTGGKQDSHGSVSKRPKLEASLTAPPSPDRTVAPRFMLTQRPEEYSAERPRPAFFLHGDAGRLIIDPQPNIFSPQKPHHRYVPGGMAAQLQSWLTEIDTAARSEPDNSMIVKVEASEGDEIIYTRGTNAQGGAIKAMLIRGAAHVSVPDHLHPGLRVEMQGPTWPMLLGEDSWTVVADWKVL